MKAEILCWLRAEADECLREWKATATKPERLRHIASTKYVVSGKVSDRCFSKSLNNRDVSKTLPAPRLCAFVNAFAAVNQPMVFEMVARIQAELERLRSDGEDIGLNGSFVLEKSVFQWFMVVGEIHIIDGPRGIAEPRHVDGAAGCLTMGVTLFGHRDLRIWPRAEEEKRGWWMSHVMWRASRQGASTWAHWPVPSIRRLMATFRIRSCVATR